MTTVAASLSLPRVLAEGWGPGAWHGPDLKAALTGLDEAAATWRPAPGRHSIAEIALHHAFYLRELVRRLTGQEPEPFELAGEDWFEVPGGTGVTWARALEIVTHWQARAEEAVAAVAEGRRASPLPADGQAALVLGITGHAVYHAGQVQLIRVLRG